VTINPATGLKIFSLRSGVATEIADLSAISTTDMRADPWCAAHIAVDPGVYELQLELPSGGTLHQTIVAPTDWHVQIFLLMRGYASASQAAAPTLSEWRADLSGAAILLTRTQTFSSNQETLRLSELARVALASKHRREPGNATQMILPEQTRDILQFKLDDPMLGIFGGHLLLLESVPDLELLGHVVANLRALVGHSHPDVEALALRTRLKQEITRFEQPPMLRRSWGIITEQSVRYPDLISDALISGPAPLLWPEDPWHVWQTSDTPETREDTDDLSELEEAVAERLGISRKVRRAARVQDRRAPSEAISVALKADDLSNVARQFGLPREQLERVIGRVQQKISRRHPDIALDLQLPPRAGVGA
jgi:hypothetical protein